MICLMCKQNEPQPGRAAVSFARADFHLVVKDVPALICPSCGEAYTDEATGGRLLELAMQYESMGAKMETRSFEQEHPRGG